MKAVRPPERSERWALLSVTFVPQSGLPFKTLILVIHDSSTRISGIVYGCQTVNDSYLILGLGSLE